MADEEEVSTVTAVAEAAVEGHEEEEQTRPEEAAAAVEAAEAEAAPAAKKKIQRKPKRRTMDAHFWGMSDAEIASIKASLAAEAEAAASSNEGGNKDATPVAAIDGEQQEDKQKEQSEHVEEEEIIPEGQLPKNEIEERRRILHTDWRMAAFSQFAHCFPHLCIKEFSIEKLERDLDGTDPGSYVGEVISRLLYHLTKDSSLAGKSPDKPWLIRLRREFLRRDPTHNKLGDGPLYVGSGDFYDDDEEDNTATQDTLNNKHTLDTGNATPNVDQSAADTPQPPNQEPMQDNEPAKAEEPQSKAEQGDNSMAVEVNSEKGVKQEEEKDDKPAWLAEFPNSKGWEDLTLQDQIYALWAVTEWHLSNADKFRNILVKYRIEPEQPFWRIEPIGYDKDYNVYWMFDDFRLWIERQTPARRQQLILLEETAERLAARERARQKRIRHEQRMRMKALHERRRQRSAAKKAAEEALDLEIAEMDEMDRKKAQEAIANGKSTGKRKRVAVQEVEEDEEFAAEEEDEEEHNANVRTSSRTSRGRKAAEAAPPPPPAQVVQTRSGRRSTRNSSAGNLAAMQIENGTEEWEKIPPEWMKSEEDERDDDPDFGAEEGQDENGGDSENDSELSMLDDDGEDVKASRKSTRSSQRQRRSSPRKPRGGRSKQAPAAGESELSDLSDVEGMSLDEAEDGEEEDGEEKIDLNEPVGHYPNSAWDAFTSVPRYDDEDKDQPEGFVHWELLIKELPEWLEFSEKYFPETEDPREVALVSWIDEQVIPRVNAELERREDVRKKEEAAKKAAERKGRIEREKAAAAAGTAPPVAAVPSKANRSFRSSRIAQKEAKEAEERAKALAEERLRQSQTQSQTPDRGTPVPTSEGQNDGPQPDPKIVERDRRAARAKEREEAKKAKEEADVLAALEESEGGPSRQPEQMGNMQAVPFANQVAMQYNGPSMMPGHMIAPTPSQGMHSMQMQAYPAPQMQAAMPRPQPEAITPVQPAPIAQSAEPVAPEPAMVEEESEDYFLDCSVCKKRGLNLDPNSRLVACDVCDRWEHVVCHRKQDEKEGRPKRDWENDPFLCEDCEGLEDSVILPSAPKRERSEKQKLGAKKGAEKRKAKSAAERAKKSAGKAAASPPVPKGTKASASKATSVAPPSSASPAPNGRSTPATGMPTSRNSQPQPQGAPGMQMPQQVQRNPSMPMQQVQQPMPSPMYHQQQHQPSHSPYHPGAPMQSPSMTPYANMPSPSLQPQLQQYPSQQYAPGQFPSQQTQSGMPMRPPSQAMPGQPMPSPHYMPQQQGQLPQYAMQQQQQAFQAGPSGFQGSFALPPQQGNFAGAPSPQMYAQQQNNMQSMYRGGMSPTQQQQPGQGAYQPGYPVASYAYGTGAPSSAFVQQQVPHNMQQQQQQSFTHLGGGMNHLPNQGHQQPPSRGPQ